MKTIIPLATVILFTPLTPAVAAEPAKDGSATEMVSYADLHLDSARDRQRLEWRVRSAASRLCTEGNRAAPTFYVNSGCFRAAMASAHRQMDEALAQARGGPTLVLARPMLTKPQARR